MSQHDIGLIGLAVMGQNLVLNMASRGYSVGVFNRTTATTDEFINGTAAGKTISGYHSVEELVANLKSPRRVMLMVKAGPAVDALIGQLTPLLDPGDIIIDGATPSSTTPIFATANRCDLTVTRRLSGLTRQSGSFARIDETRFSPTSRRTHPISPGGRHRTISIRILIKKCPGTLLRSMR